MKEPATSPSHSNQGYYRYNRPEIQQLVRPTARRILDIGCAAGMMGSELKQKLNAEVWGVEFDPNAAKQAESRLDHVLNGAIEEIFHLIPDKYFDTIIFADVLEHLINPWEVLKNVREKLAIDGEIVASIPNVRHWSVVKNLLEGNWQYENAGILDRTHLRFFTRTECVRLFETSGYEITHRDAVILKNSEPVPIGILAALERDGLDVSTLAEEGTHYQYTFIAKPGSSCSKYQPDGKPESELTSIIILTWNQLAVTQACLASIADHTPEPYELIVIDNGSSDGTVAWLREQSAADTRINLIENSTNRGFAAGCNQGIQSARGEYILLLNNDTVVTTGWLSGLREVLDRYPDAGIIGPMTNSASGVQVVANADYNSLADLPSWAATFRENNRYRIITQRRIVGFCMLFKRELVEQIGLLDESFGSGNFEDDDYCLRSELAGYRNMIAADVFVHHVGGATFAGNKINYSESMMRNMALFRDKWNINRLDETTARRLVALNAINDAKKLVLRDEADASIELLLKKGIGSDPHFAASYITLTEVLMSANRYLDALQVLTEMPSYSDRSLKSEIEAMCHSALGNDEVAQAAADRACRSPRALIVHGTLAARRNDLPGADTFFRQAIERDPSCAAAWFSLGMLLWSQAKHDEAWQSVKRSVVIDPLNEEAINILQDMATRVQKIPEAARLVAAAVQTYPDSRNLRQHHIEILTLNNQTSEALAACESFLVDFGVNDSLLPLALDLREHEGRYNRLADSGSNSISLCMIIKNEQKNLARCLASLKPVVHEIIIADTGSTDHSIDIATVFGAQVLQIPWTGNFSDARNCSLAVAQGSWILVMDADEILSPKDYESVRLAAKDRVQPVAWSVMTRNYTHLHSQGWNANDGSYPAEEFGSGGWHPSRKVRLFPNNVNIRFRGEVHELVDRAVNEAGYVTKEADFIVHHYGGLAEKQEHPTPKQLAYFQMGKEKLAKNSNDLIAIGELAVQANELKLFDEAIELWDRFLVLEPGAAVALFNRGFALMGLKRYQEALEMARQVLRTEPFHKEAAFNFGTCALYAGDVHEAIQHLETVLNQHPDHPPLLALLVALYLVTDQLHKAGATMTKLLQHNYTISDYINDRIATLESLGRTDMAHLLRDKALLIGI